MPVPELVITGVGFPPASVRGITQTLNPIGESGYMIRDVNANLHDVSNPDFQKYQSTISCSDQQPPALDGVWPGAAVTVDCIAELSYLTSDGIPARTVVASRVEGAFTFYRPRLQMRVIGYTMAKDEWGAVIGWQLELAEI